MKKLYKILSMYESVNEKIDSLESLKRRLFIKRNEALISSFPFGINKWTLFRFHGMEEEDGLWLYKSMRFGFDYGIKAECDFKVNTKDAFEINHGEEVIRFYFDDNNIVKIYTHSIYFLLSICHKYKFYLQIPEEFLETTRKWRENRQSQAMEEVNKIRRETDMLLNGKFFIVGTVSND